MRNPSFDNRLQMMEAVQNRMTALEEEESLNENHIFYFRGTIHGMISSMLVMGLINRQEFDGLYAELDTLSKLKLEDVLIDKKKALRN